MRMPGVWTLLLILASARLASAQPQTEPPEPPRNVAVTSDAADSDTLHFTWTAPHEFWWNGIDGADPELLRAWMEEAGVTPDENGEYVWGEACESYQLGASVNAPTGDWDEWFAQATVVPVGPAQDPGSDESGTLTGLQASTAYYVAVRARNSIGLLGIAEGALTISTSTDPAPPAAIDPLSVVLTGPTSVLLSWQATGDDGMTGVARWFRIYHSTAGPITLASIADGSAALAGSTPVTGGAGTPHSFPLAGLDSGFTHHFAVRAEDEAGQLSALGTVEPGVDTPPDLKSEGKKSCLGSAAGGWAGLLILVASAALPLLRRVS